MSQFQYRKWEKMTIQAASGINFIRESGEISGGHFRQWNLKQVLHNDLGDPNLIPKSHGKQNLCLVPGMSPGIVLIT